LAEKIAETDKIAEWYFTDMPGKHFSETNTLKASVVKV